MKVAIKVRLAAVRFTEAEFQLSPELVNAGFQISPTELAALASDHENTILRRHHGITGISSKLQVKLHHGIMGSELETRRKLYGTNRYEEKPSPSFWSFVWDALHDLTLIILIMCALVSIVVGLATEGWPKGIYDGLGIILSIFLVVTVTAGNDYNQSIQFRELDREKKKTFIRVTRDGEVKKVLVQDLVVGDIVHLSVGDIVPADGLFISGYSLQVDESSLTGESETIYISEGKPSLRAGSKVLDGSAKMIVTAVGMRTEWGKLMAVLSEDGVDETPLQVKLNGVATVIGEIGLAFAILTFSVLLVRLLFAKWTHNTILNWSADDALLVLNYFAVAVTIIVVAVPEGLPLAVTLSLAYAMRKLMDEKALVRHLSACETMGSANDIYTDKTGTLTTNRMVVDKAWISGISTPPEGDLAAAKLKSAVSGDVLSILLQAIYLNTSAEVTGADKERAVLGTPTEAALLRLGLSFDEDMTWYTNFKSWKLIKVSPFNSEKKRMSVLVELPYGRYRSFCKGASEIILDLCDRVITAEGDIVELSEARRTSILAIINALASNALRTLCIAFKDSADVSASEDGDISSQGYTFIALFGIKDPLREGVKESVKTCRDAGISVCMVTGDNINTAKAIAEECGVLTDDGITLLGPGFRTESLQQMTKNIPKLQVMARSSPTDKLLLVNMTKQIFHQVVAVTGDGTNDAPALHQADIGFAMGIAGTEVAKDSADVIVLDDNFGTIVKVAEWGRAVYENIQKFVQFQLTVNIVALIVNFVSACITGVAPLTAVQLLWVNMIMDTLGALALATEPPHADIMKRPPVERDDGFITPVMWRNILGQSLYQLAVLGALMSCGKPLLGLDGPDSDKTINTLIFNSFVFCQVFNEINSREIQKINVFNGILRNWLFVGIVAGTVAFQVIIVEFLGVVASTVPLSLDLWLLSVGIGSLSLIVAVILKCIPVRPHKRKAATSSDGYVPIPAGPDVAPVQTGPDAA